MRATAAPPVTDNRKHQRRPVRLPGRIIWQDRHGVMRRARVMTRDIAEHGVFIECLGAVTIPRFRLVALTLDPSKSVRDDLPAALCQPTIQSFVHRVGPPQVETGRTSGYALRLLVDPHATIERAPRAPVESLTGWTSRRCAGDAVDGGDRALSVAV
jgi:hypothetical protein